MTPTQFGFCLPIFAAPGGNLFRTPGCAELDAAATMALAKRADELGYDSLWVADHLMLGRDDAILEGWTVLSALAGATSRAKLGMIHQAVMFRNPALAAKMSATLDQISGGRLIHFMDCGFTGREYVSYGLPWDDDENVRLEMLGEATELILALWSEEQPVTWSGTHYQAVDAVNLPLPVQRPHPPIWFGEARGNVLDLCARFGQGWNTTPVSLTGLKRRLSLLREACDRAGRPFDEIELSLETQILVAPNRAALREQLRDLAQIAEAEDQRLPRERRSFAGSLVDSAEFRAFVSGETDELPKVMAEDWIVGTVDEVEVRLRDYIAEGISHFMFWFMDAPKMDGMDLFARELAPRFR